MHVCVELCTIAVALMVTLLSCNAQNQVQTRKVRLQFDRNKKPATVVANFSTFSQAQCITKAIEGLYPVAGYNMLDGNCQLSIDALADIQVSADDNDGVFFIIGGKYTIFI